MTSSRPHIERILSALSTRALGSSDTVTIRDILAGDIPRGVRAYVVAEVARWLAEDLHASPRFTRLNLGEEGMYHVQKSLLQSLAASYTLTRQEVAAAFQVAVEFTDNYLCRPQWALEHFIFAEADRVSISTVRACLDHCADYAYFPALLEGIFRRRGTTDIRREDFRHLLGRIDDQVVKQHNARELALLTKPIFDFLLLKDASPDDPIPLRPILVFFEDKKMKIMKEYVESIFRLRGAPEITLGGLSALIEELYRNESPHVVPNTPLSSAAGLRPQQGEDAPSAGAEAAGSTLLAEGPTPDAPPREQAAEHPEAGLPSPAPDQEGDAAPAPVQPLPFPEISEILTRKQRQRIIRKVFRKDEAYYAGVLSTLNQMGSWDEAVSYLQHLFEVNELDPYDRDVIAFTDAVQKRYQRPTGDAE